MKSLKLKKLVAMALTLVTVAAVSPVAASAAWKQDSHGWWNTEGDSYSTGWRSIDGEWYYFGADGYMRTGWIYDNGTWYFLQCDGAMKTGWIYYSDGKWYYTNASGAMQTGFIVDAGNTYYLNANGAMLSGWFQVNGVKYFANYSGVVQKGVIKIGDKIYYFDKDGKMVTGEVTIDGVKYTFAATGEAVGTAPKPVRAYTVDGKEVKLTDTEDAEDSSSSSSSHSGSSSSGGHGSSTGAASVKKSYEKSGEFGLVAGSKDTVKFAVSKDAFKAVNNNDYVTRDFIVEDGKVVDNGDGTYTVEPDAGKTAKVKSVVRVVRNGIVYYETSTNEISVSNN